MAKRLSPKQKEIIVRLAREGFTKQAIADEIGCSWQSVWRVVKGVKSYGDALSASEQLPAPKSYEQLSPLGKRTFDNFRTFFMEFIGPNFPRWDGTVPRFWEEIAAVISSGEFHHLLLNVAPGHGKTTLLMAYVLWRICRDRNIKVVWISKSQQLARRILRELCWHMERNTKLIEEFGRFRPEAGAEDVWSKTEIVVAGADAVTKEATVSVYGARQAILGVRVNLIIADDVADNSNSSTAEDREAMGSWWHTEPETRLEPAGVLAVIGSRLTPYDLYAELATYADPDTEQPVYRRIKFPAHDQSRCPQDGTHPAYPEGCTLWPERWPHEKLMQQKLLQGPRFALMYQQEDVPAGDTLVRREWIDGGEDPDTKELLPGCLDRARIIGERPAFKGRFSSVLTVDPSPTRFWAVEWWLLTLDLSEESSDRDPPPTWWLMDLVRRRMGASDLLDGSDGFFTGVLEDLAQRAKDMKLPLSTVILEENAGNRWLFQTSVAREWAQHWRVRLIPHTTGKNKANEHHGVWAVAPLYRSGKIRIPFGDVVSRERVEPLIEEVTTYPHFRTDDCLMAQWFLLWNLNGVKPRRPQLAAGLYGPGDIPAGLMSDEPGLSSDLPPRLAVQSGWAW